MQLEAFLSFLTQEPHRRLEPSPQSPLYEIVILRAIDDNSSITELPAASSAIRGPFYREEGPYNHTIDFQSNKSRNIRRLHPLVNPPLNDGCATVTPVFTHSKRTCSQTGAGPILFAAICVGLVSQKDLSCILDGWGCRMRYEKKNLN